jgi:DNA replication protein DnaC
VSYQTKVVASAQEWVTRLAKGKKQGRLDEELEQLGRTPLLIVDEVGYIPFDPEAASLYFPLVSPATSEARSS